MDNDTVWHSFTFFKQPAERIAFLIRQMLFPKKRIAEGQPGGNPILTQEFQYLPRITVSAADTASAPDTISRRTVNRTDLTPVIKILRMLPE